MAYKLVFNGSGYVHSPTLGNILGINRVTIINESVSINAAVTQYIYGQAGAALASRELGLFTLNGEIRFMFGGQETVFMTSAEVISAFGSSLIEADKLEMDWNGSLATLLVNNSVIKSSNFTRGTSREQGRLFFIGARGSSFTASNTSGTLNPPNGSTIGNTSIYFDGVIVREYVSDGIGLTWLDTVSGNNGTLVNFPNDNSQWEPYDDGGAENQSTVSYDLGAIDYAVSSQINAPAITATVGYDIGEIDYAVSAQQLAPGNNSSLSYDIGAISYAVSAQQSAPQFSASVGYEIGAIGFAVQANTGVAIRTITALYDIGSIGWQVDSQWLPDDAAAGIDYDIGEIAFNSSVLNIPEGGFPSEPSKQYPNNPGWRYSVFFR